MKYLFIIISFFLLIPVSLAQTNQKRFALVIGNEDYQFETKLNKPENDATAIGDELKKLGFDVMLYTNLSINDMKIHIQEFKDTLFANKGIGLFFYSGHGSQINENFYIIPVEANITDEQSIKSQSFKLKSLISELKNAQNDLNIVILDASRNNPYAKDILANENHGLLFSDLPENTIIAYSTEPGSVASDGDGSYSLYTQELIKALKKTGLTIEEIFKKVRKSVYLLSNKKQIPWESSTLKSDFYLNK